jgi:hypothetical protein
LKSCHIEQLRHHVTQFVNTDDGSWNHREYNDLAAVVKLAALDCELALREIYENATFDGSARLTHLRLPE